MHLLRDDQLHAEGNIRSFDDAMDLVHTIWNKVHPECLLTEEQPLGNDPESINLPHIVYELQSRRHSEHFSESKKPRQLKVYPDPDQPGHNITEASEHFDCYVDFLIFGNGKIDTRKWSEKFEAFVLTYTGYFKQQGVSEILFQEELPREVSSEYRQDLPHRRLRYLVRIQRIQTLRSIRLDNIEVTAQIPSQTSTDDTSRDSIVYPSSEGAEFLNLYKRTK
jgi:hypothetical protein